MDNRLDFISEIEPMGLSLMIEVREAYIRLDDVLQHFAKNEAMPLDAAAKRTLALSRTNLEISLQYAIKTLCIQYEKKPECDI